MLDELDPQSFAELKTGFDSAIERLASFDVRVGPQSRLSQYATDLQLLAHGPLPASRREMAHLVFSAIEADEIVDIISAVSDHDIDHELRQRLRDLPKGPKFRGKGTQDSGRSSQFELYGRALLTRGGLTVRMSTPDLEVFKTLWLANVEAKRPLSAESLDGNLRKALSQIRKSEKHGSILLSLDHLLLGDKNVIELEGAETFADGLKHLEVVTTSWIESNRALIDRRIELAKVQPIGSVLLVRVPIVSAELPRIGIASHLRTLHMAPQGSTERAALDEIDNALEQVWGIPT